MHRPFGNTGVYTNIIHSGLKMKKFIACALCASVMMTTICGCSKTENVNETQVALNEETSVNNTGEALSDDNADLNIENEKKEEIIVGENIIPNGDFFENSTRWGLYKESGGVANYSMKGELIVKIISPGRKAHSVQIYCDGFKLLNGGQYEVNFDISSTVKRTIESRIQLNGGDYHPYYDDENIEIGPEVTHYTKQFTMEDESDPAPRFCFNLGDADEAQQLGEHEIIIDNVSLVLLSADNVANIDLNVDERDINVNQIGYRPSDKKRAVVRNSTAGAEFEVVDASGDEVVFTGQLSGENRLGSSGDIVYYADFSKLTNPGRYYIRTKEGSESFEFSIAENVYDNTFDNVCRMLYLQRCGIDLESQYAGDFAHEACHTALATIYGTDDEIDVSGGWHDAGDYGRYTVPAAKTVADLMLAYENYPEVFSDNAGIPESGNDIPDILDETRYELEWLLKMQSENGGIYHKVTGLNFDGIVWPTECEEKLYVLPESKTATGDFAAAMYMASRVYADIDSAFAKECMIAAKKALPYLEERLSESNYVNPDDVLTGEYPDKTAMDEYLWALCEGYKTTGDKEFAEKLMNFNYKRISEEGLGWATVTGYAYYAFLTSGCDSEGIPYDFGGSFIKIASEARDISLKECYGSSIKDIYTWGSNMTICNNGMEFLMAYDLTGDESYIEAAQNQLNYIFGVNTCSYCFVTGEGTLSPVSPHHRPSQVLGKAMPGMLAGGPDSNLEDPFAKTVLKDEPNAHRYIDNAQSYSCNEVTIYWNSPLIYLMAGLESVY